MKYQHPTIENLLLQFKSQTGKDHSRYKNHVYRVFLNCLSLDDNKQNEEKYAIAAVFHDIGIWTDHTVDYLPPSIEQVKRFLSETGRNEWIEEISLMILWHHKIGRYKGPFEITVGNFRKADWIDVSLGIKTFGVSRSRIREGKKMFPNAGFHFFLLKITSKNFFRHPLNPLPMFKK